jgi:hypothetical protein
MVWCLCCNVRTGRGTANPPGVEVSNFAKPAHFLPVDWGPAVVLQL